MGHLHSWIRLSRGSLRFLVRIWGGLSAELSHLSIGLHLDVTENATLPIAYDTGTRAHIHRLARLTGDDADVANIITGGHIEIKQRLKNEWGETKGKRLLDSDPK